VPTPNVDCPCAHACAQIQGPSGKALFQWTANTTGRIDFYICALSFGTNAVGERQRIGATLSVYQNGQFIWCARAPAHDHRPCQLSGCLTEFVACRAACFLSAAAAVCLPDQRCCCYAACLVEALRAVWLP
jgi:hypothetical protein